MGKIIDSYSLYARFFPSIVSSLPFFVIWFFLADNLRLKELGSFLLSLEFYGGTTLSVVGLYFYAQVIRITSKWFEGKIFSTHTNGFPTTYLMMYDNETFSQAYKDTYRHLVKKHFNMDLLSIDLEKEQKLEAQKRLNEATKQVILRVGNGKLVKQHNIWYGFNRNLVGGAVYSIALCLTGLGISVVNQDRMLALIMGCLGMLFGTILIFHRRTLKQTAESYAQQLIAEFISMG